MLNDTCQSRKDQYCMIPFYKVPKTVKVVEAENRKVVTRDWGDRAMGSCCSISIKFQLCKMNTF